MRDRRWRRLVPFAAAAVAVLTLASAASAVTIDDVELTGPEGATWDAEGDYTYGTSGGPCTGVDGTTQEKGYTPAADVSNDFTSDAFDGGLYLLVNGDAYGDGVNQAKLSAAGHQLNVKAEEMAGLSVRRQDRALTSSPTLRSLVTFTNPGANDRTVNVVWDSAMGADGLEGTRASSTHDLVHTKADRWIAVSDDADSASLSDEPVLFVFSGVGASEKVRTVIWAPEDADPVSGIGQACIAVQFRITVPGHSQRALLFFTDVAMDNEDAISQAPKYNLSLIHI